MPETISKGEKINAALEAARAKVEAKKAAKAETVAREAEAKKGKINDLTAERQHLVETKQATAMFAAAASDKVQNAFQQKAELEALNAELGEQMDPEVATTFDQVFKEAQNADEDLVDLDERLAAVDKDIKALESDAAVEAPEFGLDKIKALAEKHRQSEITRYKGWFSNPHTNKEVVISDIKEDIARLRIDGLGKEMSMEIDRSPEERAALRQVELPEETQQMIADLEAILAQAETTGQKESPVRQEKRIEIQEGETVETLDQQWKELDAKRKQEQDKLDKDYEKQVRGSLSSREKIDLFNKFPSRELNWAKFDNLTSSDTLLLKKYLEAEAPTTDPVKIQYETQSEQRKREEYFALERKV